MGDSVNPSQAIDAALAHHDEDHATIDRLEREVAFLTAERDRLRELVDQAYRDGVKQGKLTVALSPQVETTDG